MRGLPSIKEIRSISRFGLSSVAVYFDEKLDIYFARRLVMERLPDAAATIPQGYGPPQMTPCPRLSARSISSKWSIRGAR
jgi:cobalt-zinc-cadmium resistance protein CzcA